MGIKTVPHPPYCPDLAPCDFWLFPKLRGCRYETNKEMKEAVTKVIDTLTQEDFHGALQKLSERYNKCIAAGGDYFEGDKSFMCVLSIKVPIRKKSGNLFNDPRISFTFRLKPIRCIIPFNKKFKNICSIEGVSQKVSGDEETDKRLFMQRKFHLFYCQYHNIPLDLSQKQKYELFQAD